jgi:hypothetical protein
MKAALETYGIPIEVAEGRAVGKYLAAIDPRNVCSLDDLQRAVSQYVVY